MVGRLRRIRRKLKARLIAAGLSLAIIITIGGLFGAILARAAPSWWRQYRPTDELRERAVRIENAAITHLTLVRPADPEWERADDPGPWHSKAWSIMVKEADASAWLTARLPEWIDGQADLSGWPDALSQPQVHFDDGLIRLGVLLRRHDGDRILTASFRPQIDANGSLWLHTNWVHVGRLPLPAQLILARAGHRLESYLPESIADDPYSASFIDVLRGKAPLAIKPELSLQDGRVVRLLAIRVREGRIELDCRTESRDTLAKH
ncbi:MAG: hypothetical protein H6810_06100 [Phycisphaeraceae bacterium]|nr:MAG: hypothetical protein H6810_06100 [Phycisphaeraceae bacterium]